MAQGFVKNLNLVESDSSTSDAAILNNLGKGGIADDIRLFDGNNKFVSRLKNDPNAVGPAVDYGFLTLGLKYKIMTLGEGRDWSLVGWSANNSEYGTGDSVQVNDIFVATDAGFSFAGEGGIVVPVLPRQDLFAVNDPLDGWTFKANLLRGKRAFPDGTKLRLNSEAGYDYEVFNSDGVESFQLRNIVSQATLPLTDITTVSLTRDDSILPINIRKLIVKSGAEDSSLGEGEEAESDDDELYKDPFVYRIPLIDDIISDINYKKKNTILTYQPNTFSPRNGVQLTGVLSIVNNPSSGTPIIVGAPTDFGSLVVGEKYQITTLGSGADWDDIGAGTIATGVKIVEDGSFDNTNSVVYKIKSLGTDTRGVKTFGVSDMNGGSNTINLGSGHSLVAGNKVRLTKLATDDDITQLPANADYFVHSSTISEIKLSLTVDGDAISFSVPSVGTNYTLTIDIQSIWNTIGGTTSSPITYSVGDFFTANASGAGLTIQNAEAYPVIFIATGVGNAGSSGSTAKALEPPGLYIHNSMTDEAKRAFTGKDNPWNDINKIISTRGVSINIPALFTSSAIAQAGDFNFAREDETDYGSFVDGENYTITDLGTSRQWTTSGNFNGVTPAVGVSFTADDSSINTSGSGGKAIGEPKLLFTNSQQIATLQSSYQDENNDTIIHDGLTAFPDDASGVPTSVNISGQTITHKIPIIVNGEEYFLVANSSASDVAAGNYRILATPSS